MKYLIFSTPYHPLSGGVICLHHLCHLLNELGNQAYIHPSFENVEFNSHAKKKAIRALYKAFLTKVRTFRTNPEWNTPLIRNFEDLGQLDDWVIIYPEIVFGNPLGGKNVVRWLLHNPGHHTGKIYYGKNELYFKYSQAFKDFTFPGSVTSTNELRLTSCPRQWYNENGITLNRKGTAYCLRKGRDKKIQHDLTDSTLIDNLSHEETSKVFKRVRTFVSYDTVSAYSRFAILCGCDSVVIPDEGVSETEWLPNPTDRYGIAYGFENLEKARSTRNLVSKQILIEEEKNKTQVAAFVEEVEDFFASR